MSVGKTTYNSFSPRVETVVCTPIPDLLRQPYPPTLGAATLDLIAKTGCDPKDVFIPAGEQAFKINNVIGTETTERTTETDASRLVAVQCPKSPAERCGNCVMTLLGEKNGKIVSTAFRNAGYQTPDPLNPSHY